MIKKTFNILIKLLKVFIAYFNFLTPYLYYRVKNISKAHFSGKNYKKTFVLVDFDGTLVDSLSIIINELNILFKKNLELTISKEEFRQFESIYWLKKTQIYPLFLPIYIEKIKKSLQKNSNQIFFFDGIEKTLKNLYNQGFRFGILTSNSCHFVANFLRERNITTFEFVAESVGLTDKDKSITNLLEKYQLERKKIIYIGDEVRDIVCMKKANIAVISAAWGWASEKILQEQNPWAIAKKPEELEAYIHQFESELQNK